MATPSEKHEIHCAKRYLEYTETPFYRAFRDRENPESFDSNYAVLKRMEEAELVTSEWETPEEGSGKRLFTLTDKGRHCLRRWIDALACYELTLEELRGQAAQALGIDLPDAPICSHEE